MEPVFAIVLKLLKKQALCRHEILNEINKEEIYSDILTWIENKVETE